MMKKLRPLILIILFLPHVSLYGQTPVIQWQKIYGSSLGDYPNAIRATSDGGFIVTGNAEGNDGDVVGYHGKVGSGIALGDLWVIKMDGTGEVQWKKCLGGTWNEEMGGDILQTPDGGYVVIGPSASKDCYLPSNHGSLDCYMAKLSPTGDIQWQQMLGGVLNEYPTSLTATADGGYIIGGYTNSKDIPGYHDNNDPYNNFDMWVAKVDATGNIQWQKALGGTGNDQCFSVSATPDGGVIAAGSTESTNGDVTGFHGQTDAWVVKLDNAGAIQWQKSLGGAYQDGARSIQLTSDGGYIMAGYAASNDGDVSGNHTGLGVGDRDFWVVKFNGGGTMQWQKCYGGNLNETAFAMQPTADGGYMVSGDAESHDGDLSCNAGLSDAWVIKIDATGSLIWSKSMGGAYYEEAYALQPLADGGCVIAAETCSKDIPGYHVNGTSYGSCSDYWIVRLSPPVAAAPATSVTLSPPPGVVCAGAAATFTATVNNAGTSPAYSWKRNGVSVGSNNARYTASDFKEGDILSVAVTAGTGICDNYPGQVNASVTVHLSNNILHPDIKITSGSSFICDCSPVNFKATVTNGGGSPHYQWMLNGAAMDGTNDSWLCFGVKPTDVVTCQYSDLSGCIANAPLSSNAITLSAGTAQPATITISGPSDKPCTGSAMTFTATPVNAGANPVYQWKVNGINAGANNNIFTSQTLVDGDKVTCTVAPDVSNTCTIAGNATSNTVVASFTAKGTPMVSITSPTAVICKGLPQAFKATATNGGDKPDYQWKVNGTNAGTNSPDFSQVFNDGDIVQCTITVDPGYSCASTGTASSSPVTVQVIDQPVPSVNITVDGNNACAGDPISFNAVVSNAGPGASIQWMVNGTPQKDKTPNFSSRQLQNDDIILCTVTPGSGACLSAPVLSNAIQVVIYPLPLAAISPADTIVFYNGQAILHAITSPDVIAYQWTPAYQLENPQTLNPVTVPLQEDVTFSLTAETSHQCRTVANAFVKIYRALTMPSAFTPNGDGVNDVFRIPPGITLQLKEFSVFNRWGGRIFSSQNINKGWDGTINGRPAQTGAYAFIITGTDAKGPVMLAGTVMLIR